MANDLTGNPWKIDTGATITTEKARIARIRWVGATTAGHTVTVTNSAGTTIWASEAAGANHVESELIEREYDGVIVTAIGSGTLYITRSQRPSNF